MTVLTSTLNRRTPDYQRNAAAMAAQLARLDQLLARIREGGGAKAQARHTARGKLLPRQRIDLLLDPGSPFLEIAPWPPSTSTRKRYRPPGWWPASAASRASSA